jgi:hypothetical protein
MSSPNFRAVRLLISTVFLLLASLPALADSQVRIVRLSYVEGGVQIDRGTGQFEKAMVNLPISQGARLRTSSDGRAEVEFEDGSTLRLTPETAIEFPQLLLRDSGGKASTVEVKKGTVYLDYAASKNEEFIVQFARETVRLSRAAHLRIGIAEEDAAVAVFKGEIQVEGPSGTVQIKKNQTGNFDLSNDDSYELAKNIDQEPFDSWDKQQSDFHMRYASNSSNRYSPYAYGTSDLAYYGNFFNAPGYGMMWQPYFAGVGWDPFMDGAWAYSPGWGFGWVSAYPWGWTPYHYGTWVFLPGYGWAWQPGGVWTTWYARPRVLNAPRNFVAPQPPSGGRTTVVVNRGPTLTLANRSGSKLMIPNNSAGLGVRRGEVNNLAKVSQQVQARGTVTERVHGAPIIRTDSSRGFGTAGSGSGGSRGSRSSAGGTGRATTNSSPSVHSSAPPPASGGHGHR